MGSTIGGKFSRAGGELIRIEDRRIILLPAVSVQPGQDEADVTFVRVKEFLASDFREINRFGTGRTVTEKAAADKQSSEGLHLELPVDRAGAAGPDLRAAPV
jgi:hypothetical protein